MALELKDLDFFRNFPEFLLGKLESCVETLKLAPGENLLEQGKRNHHLYFLVSGELDVKVDGGLVAKLHEPGDLIGEMSLISQKSSSASIQASQSTQVLKIDGPSLHKICSENNTGDWNVYKIYSDILVQKLEATNQKAKKIEGFVSELEMAQEKLKAANASLEIKVEDRTQKIARQLQELKQKNTELVASHNKIKDLYQSRDLTFTALGELLEKNLRPLMEKINPLDPNILPGIDSVKRNLKRSMNRIEPLTTSFLAEKSMNSKKVLFAESVKKQQTIARMALGGTGIQLEVAASREEVEEKLSQKDFNILLFTEEFLDLTENLINKYPDLKMVFVASKDIPQYVSTLLKHKFIPNVIFRDEDDKQFTIKNFVTTISKLASGNYFGLEKYMAWGVDSKELEVEGSEHRFEVIEKIDDYFNQSGIRSSNRGRLTTVLEELLMNAVYDAPKDKEGKPLYNHKDRTETVVLNEAHRPLVRFATDGVLLAVSVEDPFGGLEATTLFKYLEKCYTSKESLNDNRADKAGGGRGLHQIIENSDLVVFNIDFGKRTEVIALFNADPKLAPVRNPVLHFFKAS